MYIKNMYIKNFRNYNDLKIDYSDKLNIFIGENAQGKTNLLESIYYMAIGKSFRTSKDLELIYLNENNLYYKMNLIKKNTNESIEIGMDRLKNKKIKVNDNEIKKKSELLGILNVVIFSPEDLKIIKGGPKERRDFLDNDLNQIMKSYNYYLLNYNKILKTRNKILKEYRYKKIDLEPWNIQLINYGSNIIFLRKEFIKRLSILTKLIHRKITNERENLKVKYISSFDIEMEFGLDEIKNHFRNNLKMKIKEEIERRSTLIGPHRDDLDFYINDMDVKKYGSQGQQRTTVLSLKLGELELMKKETGEYPILLLDDVMSELDEFRQKDLIGSLKNIQTFITTTDYGFLEKINKYKLFEIKNGQIKKINTSD